jgi:hypothetical protein
MRILFEVVLIIIIVMFAYKAFTWLFPSKTEKGRKKENIEEEDVNNIK